MRIKYPNIILFLVSIAVAVVLSRIGVFQYLAHLGNLGYIGAFVFGFLLSFTFATPLATAGFFYLGQASNLWAIIAIGTLGSLCSDVFIWRFIKGGIFTELEEIWQNYENHHPHRYFTPRHSPHLKKLFHTRSFHYIKIFSGAALLFSPVPDEVALELLAFYRLSLRQLTPLSIASGIIAIWLIVGAGRLVLG